MLPGGMKSCWDGAWKDPFEVISFWEGMEKWGVK